MRLAVVEGFRRILSGQMIVSACVLCSLAWCIGCRSSESAAGMGRMPGSSVLPAEPPMVGGIPMQPVADWRPGAPDRYAFAIRLNMYRVEVPVGMVSHSERLWRYLDEEITDLPTISALHRNGFRVGLAKLNDWPPVGGLLREMAGRALVRTSGLTWPGRPRPVMLKEHQGSQRMFTFAGDGTLQGRDYPPGDNLLMITCHLNTDDPSEVILQVVPMVRSARKMAHWDNTDLGYKRRWAPVTLPVEELEFTVKVPQGHYLLIGPGTAVTRSISPGCRFLVTQKGGHRRETVLVIIPEVFAAPP